MGCKSSYYRANRWSKSTSIVFCHLLKSLKKTAKMKNKDKIILDLCGGTGAWSKPYKDAGYSIYNITLPSFDILSTTISEYKNLHFKGKEKVLGIPIENVYGILAAPPCTMFSDARTNAKTPRDLRGAWEIVEACLKIIRACMFLTVSDQQKYSPLKFWALENPWYGRLKWFLGSPCYTFDPWEFGDAYQKKTALWGYFNYPVKFPVDLPKQARTSTNRGKPQGIWKKEDIMTQEQIEKHKTNSQTLPKFDHMLMPEIKKLKGVNDMDYWKNTNLRQTLRSITPQGFAQAFFKANQ